MHENVIGFEGGVQMHLHLSGTLMPLAVFTPLRSSPCRAAEEDPKVKLQLLDYSPSFTGFFCSTVMLVIHRS